MPLSLFEFAYIRARSTIGELDWCCMTELQRADLICCEMYRLAKMGGRGKPQILRRMMDAGAPKVDQK